MTGLHKGDGRIYFEISDPVSDARKHFYRLGPTARQHCLKILRREAAVVLAGDMSHSLCQRKFRFSARHVVMRQLIAGVLESRQALTRDQWVVGDVEEIISDRHADFSGRENFAQVSRHIAARIRCGEIDYLLRGLSEKAVWHILSRGRLRCGKKNGASARLDFIVHAAAALDSSGGYVCGRSRRKNHCGNCHMALTASQVQPA